MGHQWRWQSRHRVRDPRAIHCVGCVSVTSQWVSVPLMHTCTSAPVFVQNVRLALGPDALVVANAAGALSDGNLNGLTLEMEACKDPQVSG
jgi:hypothetical protein